MTPEEAAIIRRVVDDAAGMMGVFSPERRDRIRALEDFLEATRPTTGAGASPTPSGPVGPAAVVASVSTPDATPAPVGSREGST